MNVEKNFTSPISWNSQNWLGWNASTTSLQSFAPRTCILHATGYLQTNFTVGLTNNPPDTMSPLINGFTWCGQWVGNITDGETMFVPCRNYLPSFRYVVIIGNGPGLMICELEVYPAGTLWLCWCKQARTMTRTYDSFEKMPHFI